MLTYCQLQQTSAKFELKVCPSPQIAFEDVICKSAAMLFKPQCVDATSVVYIPTPGIGMH